MHHAVTGHGAETCHRRLPVAGFRGGVGQQHPRDLVRGQAARELHGFRTAGVQTGDKGLYQEILIARIGGQSLQQVPRRLLEVAVAEFESAGEIVAVGVGGCWRQVRARRRIGGGAGGQQTEGEKNCAARVTEQRHS